MGNGTAAGKYLSTKPRVDLVWKHILEPGVHISVTWITAICNAEPLWQDLSIVQQAADSFLEYYDYDDDDVEEENWEWVQDEVLQRKWWLLSLRRSWIVAAL